MSSSYDFWIDNGLALVGSPEAVIRQLARQHQFIGYDLFCANHRFRPMPVEQSLSAAGGLKLFGDPEAWVELVETLSQPSAASTCTGWLC
jgi:hypothetical protein